MALARVSDVKCPKKNAGAKVKVNALRLLIICLVAGGGVVGCAGVSLAPPEDQVRSRAEEWLASLMGSDLESAYEFTSPAYRSAHSLRHYAKAYAGRDMWRAAEIGSIECDKVGEFGQCDLILSVTYRGFMMADEMTTDLPQKWVQIDGIWYTTVSQ